MIVIHWRITIIQCEAIKFIPVTACSVRPELSLQLPWPEFILVHLFMSTIFFRYEHVDLNLF